MEAQSCEEGCGLILLVDDDPNFRRVLKHQLREMHLAVEDVGDVDCAVERCKAGGVALVIIDVNLPAASALGCLRLIKLAQPEVPVIVVSAFSSMENVATALRWGACDFLEKPCDLERLHRSILQNIGGQALTIEQ